MKIKNRIISNPNIPILLPRKSLVKFPSLIEIAFTLDKSIPQYLTLGSAYPYKISATRFANITITVMIRKSP